MHTHDSMGIRCQSTNEQQPDNPKLPKPSLSPTPLGALPRKVIPRDIQRLAKSNDPVFVSPEANPPHPRHDQYISSARLRSSNQHIDARRMTCRIAIATTLPLINNDAIPVPTCKRGVSIPLQEISIRLLPLILIQT